ncbi:MAG: beta-lactamase family protein [Chloroflexales bacterium]|nr:beta-lactamase family protein [Chloroflexales bacterium]
MKKVLKALLIILGFLLVLYRAFRAWASILSPTFEPVTYKPIPPDYWPTDGFQTSRPEEQGMDSAKLLEILDFYAEAHARDPGVAIDSLSVYRNGYLIADLYFNPLYPKDTSHIINSCTKSIMSALIGIAIEQGYIESVDVPIVEFFQDKESAISDERMNAITIKDLLTMKTGIRSRDSFLYQWEGNFAMQATDDWVAYILSLPVDAEPGVRFDYSNMSSFMLSAIIHEATGRDTLAFARENLFDPIGIGEVRWEWSPQGIGIGFARMWMKPQDMAKFGLLYLQQGQWDGEQIVPAEWVKESVIPHAYPKNYVDILDENGKKDNEASLRNLIGARFFRAFADGYGYQWWLDKSGSYAAVGVGGQYIMVAPQQNLVLVVTSSSSGTGVFFPKNILDQYVLPAIVSDEAIAANVTAHNQLVARSGPPELNLEVQPIPELPPIALEISGETYALEKNNLKYDNFKLLFDPALDYAEFSYTAKESDVASFKVGLDGVYRFSETDIGPFAAYGSWITPQTFEITCRQVGYSTGSKFILTFDGDVITVAEFGVVGASTYSGTKQRYPTEKTSFSPFSGL